MVKPLSDRDRDGDHDRDHNLVRIRHSLSGFTTKKQKPSGTQGTLDRVATGQEMVRKKINQGQGEVPEFYFESGKIDTLKKSQGKLK